MELGLFEKDLAANPANALGSKDVGTAASAGLN